MDFQVADWFEGSAAVLDLDISLTSESTDTFPSSSACRLSSLDGLATFRTECTDSADNAYLATNYPDLHAPRTSLFFDSEPFVDSMGRVFSSTDSAFSLAAQDPDVPNHDTSGVGFIGFALNSPAVSVSETQPYSGSFMVSEGSRAIVFGSRDIAGNEEVLHSTTVFMDGTPPITEMSIIGPSSTDSRGSLIISTSAAISLSGSDPISGGAAAGLSRILYRVDRGTISVFRLPFTVSEGFHQIQFYGVDNTENSEAAHNIASFWGVDTDTQPPVTQFVVSGSSVIVSGVLIVQEGAGMGLVAGDAPLGPVGAGVEKTLILVDIAPGDCPGGLPATLQDPTFAQGTCENPVYTSTFTLGAGLHSLTFFSVDRIGIEESPQSLQVEVRLGGLGGINSPGSLRVVSASSAAITLAWEPNNPPGTGFVVAYGTAPSAASCSAAESAFPRRIETTSTTATISGLLAGTPYQIIVCNATGPGLCDTPILTQTRNPGEGEQPNPSYSQCGSPPPASSSPTVSGLAIAADPVGSLWMVLRGTATFSLAKFTPQGVLESAVPLPGAGDFGAWGIGFDSGGNAVAVGSTLGETTGEDVAVYRVSPEGTVLSSAVFDAGLGKADIALDASGDVWITGAVQTGGESETDIQAQLALWKYTPQDGLRLKSLYAGPGGLDAGAGVRTDSSGNIWIVGFSSNPAAPGPNKLDLALWKYEATGSSLAAGPFRKPGFARGIGETTNAKLAIFTDSLYVTAGKLNGTGDTDLMVSKHDLAGAQAWSRSWRSDPAAEDVPAAVLASDQGLSVAGGVFRGQDRSLAYWRYSLDGAFYSAETSSGVGKANDAASNAEGTWLAVEDRGTPYKFMGGTALPGAPVDNLPPRTTLTVGSPQFGTEPLYIATHTPLGFLAMDDSAQVGDGQGTGVKETLFLIDVDPQSCEGVPLSSSARQGTCANPVFGSTFTLEAGTHTIAFLSRDNAGNEEAPKMRGLTVDAEPPITSLLSSIGAFVDMSSSAFYAGQTAFGFEAVDPPSTSAASGVALTEFRVDAGTAAASFETFVSTFALAEGLRLIEFRSADNLGNLETIQTATVFIDATAPLTTMTFVGPQFSSGTSLYASGQTQYLLEGQDPVSHGVASGVRETLASVDTAGFSIILSTMPAVPEGAHQFLFLSVDNVLNREATKFLEVLVDTTPPAAVFRIAGSSFTDALGRLVISTSSLVVLEAQDPVSAGVASGVEFIRFGTTGTFQDLAYSSFTFLALSEGRHTVVFEAKDRVGNVSALSSFQVLVDTTSPSLDEARVSRAGQNQYVAASEFISALNVDAAVRARDLVSGLAPGAVSARLSKNGGASFTAVGTLTLSGSSGTVEAQNLSVPGLGVVESVSSTNPRNLLEVSATDVAGNKSTLTFGIFVDTTLPSIAIVSPSSNTTALLNTRTPTIVLTYTDALSGINPASLVVEVDGVPIPALGGASGASITTPALADGTHQVAARIADRAGNMSPQALVKFTIDATPPNVIVREPPAGAFFNVSTRAITAFYEDLGSSLDPTSLRLLLDDAALSPELSLRTVANSALSLAPWTAAAPIPQSQFSFGMEAWGKWIYALGGEENGGPVAGVYYAEVSAGGVLGAWTATTPLPVPLRTFTSAVVNGIIYALGGAGPSSASAAVYFARVEPNGSLGPWTATASLPTALFGLTDAATTVCGPYIYVIGGTTSSTPRADVHYSRVNADGSLGPWTATTFLPAGRNNPRAVEINKRVYVLGGEGGGNVPQKSVYVGEVQPDGRILSWSPVADLPIPLARGAAVTSGDRIVYLGGQVVGHANSTQTFVTLARGDGTLDPWVKGPGLPLAVVVPGAAVVEAFVYLAGADPVTIGHVAFKSKFPVSVPAATATFTASGLAEGSHEATASASDLAGNLGQASSAFSLDFTAPVSTFSPLGFSRFLGGRTHVSASVPLAIQAFDPVAAGVASGVKETLLKKDAGPLTPLAGTFSLADGTHTAAFQSRDNAGNLEILKTALLRVDSAAPGTVTGLFGHSPTTSSLVLDWTSAGDDDFFGAIEFGEVLAQSSTQAAGLSTATAHVVKDLRDQGPGQGLSVQVSGLQPGTTYFFALWTRDTAGNYSGASNVMAVQTLALAGSADGVAGLVSPRADMTISTVATASAPGQYAAGAGQGLQLLTTGFYELSPSGVAFSTPAVFTFVLDPGGADLSQIAIYRFNGVSWDSAPVSGQTVTQLAGGFIEIKGFLLSASLYGVFQRIDIFPPRTELAAGAPKTVGGGTAPGGGSGTIFLTGRTVLTLSSLDDRFAFEDSLGLGVALQKLKVDGAARSTFANPAPGPGQVFASTFTLPDADGLRIIGFQARDVVGNTEAEKQATFALDNTAPATSLAVSTPAFGSYVSTRTTFALTGLDPVTDGVASGVEFTRYGLNGGLFLHSPLSFSLGPPDGSYFLEFQSQDRVGNLAALSSITAILDAAAPASSLLVNGQAAGGQALVLITTDAVSFAAADSGSGVRETSYSLDGAPEQAFGAAFTLAVGTHVIRYASIDNVFNQEAPRQADLTILAIDTTPPNLALSPPNTSTVTTVRPLIRADYSDQGRGIDAASVRLELDGVDVTAQAEVTASSAAFAPFLDLSQGTHLIGARVRDLAGNSSDAASRFFLDSIAPATSLLVNGQAAGGSALVLISTDSISFAAADAGTGVREARYSLDAAPEQAFGAIFTLAAGTHTLAYRSQDYAGNLDTAQLASLTVFVPDVTAPSLALSPPHGSTVTAPRPLIRADYSDQGRGIDLASVRFEFDGIDVTAQAAVTASSAAFAPPADLSQGTHLIGAKVMDLAGNTSLASSRFFLDSIAPVIALQSPLAGERYVAGFSTIAVRFTVTDNLDLAPFFTASLAQLEDRGSPRGFRPALLPVSTGQMIDPLSLDDGLWELMVQARDFAGNASSAAGGGFEVIHDSIPPITALVIGEPKLDSSPVVVASSTLFGFVATDDISGVAETRWALDAGAFQVYNTSFSLSSNGLHVIHWLSVDRAANREALQSSTVAVDAQAPALSLACPGSEGGVCSIFRENVAVRGSVFDERLAQYKLESGGALISSGTKNTEGVLGTWDLSSLAGAQALSLSAADLLGNEAFLTRRVFIGEPARLLVFGGKKDFGLPQGVAVDNQRGVVYVANTNKGEIRLYTLAGAFIKAYPDISHPRAVAVDEGGNLYIAESGKDRIVKLSPAGSPLWTKGRGGRKPSEFRDPSGIAAGGGKVAISDTRNRRVQVLNQDGDFLFEFPMPEGSQPMIDDDGEQDDEPGNKRGVPVGIALDGHGRIYAADAKNRKGLAFSPDGRLLKEFGGSALFARPEGIAVSTSGECVFLSDRIKDRITKFDATGRVTLTFGTQGNIKENKPLPVETVFRRPIGLALDTAGTLWVADRNNEVIQRFGLPGMLVAGAPAGGTPPRGLRAGEDDADEEEAPRAAADFYLREAYAVPNPCKSCGSQGFVVQVGLADSVGLECRSMLGRVIYQNAFGGPTIKDIGNGRGSQYTYEQHWPLSGVGTGVYACVVTARKAGKPEIRKVVRSAIIK